MGYNLGEILIAAQSEAKRMRAVVQQVEPGDKISMEAAQFGKLSEIIDVLCSELELKQDEMGSPRYWVPLQVFRDLKRKLEGDEPGWVCASEGGQDFIVDSWDHLGSPR